MRRLRTRHPVYTLSSIRLRSLPAHSQLSERQSPVPLLLYVTRGEGWIQVGQHTWSIDMDGLVYIPAGVTFRAKIGSSSVEYYQLLIRAAELSYDSSGCHALVCRTLEGLPEHNAIVVHGGKQWRQLLRDMQAAYTSASSRQCDRDILLLQAIKELKASTEREPAAPMDGIQQTIDYMEKHYATRIMREALARIAMLAPGAYCRSFKKSLGVTPTDYLQHIRIQHAKQHLAQGASLKEAAAAVSYRNEFHFSRVFKKVTGIPPSLYIKREFLRIALATRFHWRDNLQAMGVTPILTVDCYRHPGMDEHEYERRVMLHLEELRAVKPDLIIADFSHEPFYDTFKKIAPTVTVKHSLDWRWVHRQLSELVGREREAEDSLEQSEHGIAEAATRFRRIAAGQQIAMLQVMPDHIMLQGTVRHPLNELLYHELSLQADPAVPRDHLRLQAAPQDIPALHADHVWVRQYNEQADVQRVFGRLQERPFWQDMPAAQHGKVQLVTNWLLMSWTPQGRQEIVAEIGGYLGECQL